MWHGYELNPRQRSRKQTGSGGGHAAARAPATLPLAPPPRFRVGALPRAPQHLADTVLMGSIAIWATFTDQERSMTTRKILMLAALISIAPAGLVMAQSQTTPQDTSPSAASSPSQRNATSSSATEAPTSSDSTSPAAASSPHQQQSTHVASKQAMKDCVAKQKQDNSGISAADAKKACKQQMKGSG